MRRRKEFNGKPSKSWRRPRWSHDPDPRCFQPRVQHTSPVVGPVIRPQASIPLRPAIPTQTGLASLLSPICPRLSPDSSALHVHAHLSAFIPTLLPAKSNFQRCHSRANFFVAKNIVLLHGYFAASVRLHAVSFKPRSPEPHRTQRHDIWASTDSRSNLPHIRERHGKRQYAWNTAYESDKDRLAVAESDRASLRSLPQQEDTVRWHSPVLLAVHHCRIRVQDKRQAQPTSVPTGLHRVVGGASAVVGGRSARVEGFVG